MKLLLLTSGVLISPLLLANPGVRDATTHEQLVAQRRAAVGAEPMKGLAPSVGADSTKVNQPESLMSRSDVIKFGGYATLVPKRAILHIPVELKDRMGISDDVRLMPWPQFYVANRGWITTYEVSRSQAAGQEPLGEEILKQMEKGANLIVATYKSGPISVLPLKVPEEPEGTEKPEDTTTNLR